MKNVTLRLIVVHNSYKQYICSSGKVILHGKVILPAVREAFNEMLIIFSTIFFSPSKLQLCKIICHLSDRIGVNKRIDFKVLKPENSSSILEKNCL